MIQEEKIVTIKVGFRTERRKQSHKTPENQKPESDAVSKIFEFLVFY